MLIECGGAHRHENARTTTRPLARPNRCKERHRAFRNSTACYCSPFEIPCKARAPPQTKSRTLPLEFLHKMSGEISKRNGIKAFMALATFSVNRAKICAVKPSKQMNYGQLYLPGPASGVCARCAVYALRFGPGHLYLHIISGILFSCHLKIRRKS